MPVVERTVFDAERNIGIVVDPYCVTVAAYYYASVDLRRIPGFVVLVGHSDMWSAVVSGVVAVVAVVAAVAVAVAAVDADADVGFVVAVVDVVAPVVVVVVGGAKVAVSSMS